MSMKNSRVWRPVVPRGLRKRAATLAAELEVPLHVISKRIYHRGLIEMEAEAQKDREYWMDGKIEKRSTQEGAD